MPKLLFVVMVAKNGPPNSFYSLLYPSPFITFIAAMVIKQAVIGYNYDIIFQAEFYNALVINRDVVVGMIVNKY